MTIEDLTIEDTYASWDDLEKPCRHIHSLLLPNCWNWMRPWKLPSRRCQTSKYTLYHLSEKTKQNVFFISHYIFHLLLSLKGHVFYIYKKHSHLRKHSFHCLCLTQPPPCSRPIFFLTSFYIRSSFYETCFILKSFQVKKRFCTFLSQQILGRLSLRPYRPFSERSENLHH